MRFRYASWWILAAIIVGVLLSACGGSGKKPPPARVATELHYADPEEFADGSPIPAGAIVRTLHCGASPNQLSVIDLSGHVIPLGQLMELGGLPYGREVHCVGTATVAGVAGAPSGVVKFFCQLTSGMITCVKR